MSTAALPHMRPVASSNVESVGYDQDRHEMHVRFKGGAHYVYDRVPASLHTAALGADSIGKFIAERIKGMFGHRKL